MAENGGEYRAGGIAARLERAEDDITAVEKRLTVLERWQWWLTGVGAAVGAVAAWLGHFIGGR